MKFSSVSQLALASLAAASPVAEKNVLKPRSGGYDDVTIGNFALTLEHLENAFYAQGMQMFTQADFDAAGYTPARLRFNINQIGVDEATHVTALQTLLGDAAVPPCSYDFGLTDVKSFVKTAGILEGVGITAYLGAARFIDSGDILTAAGSILTIEARHSAYLRDSQKPPQAPTPYPFDVPLTVQQVYTLASAFITSCPPKADLGLTPSPRLIPRSVAKMPARAGMWVPLAAQKKVKLVDGSTFAYFIGNAGYIPADVQLPPPKAPGNRIRVKVPQGVAGQSYVILSSASSAADVSDDNTLAGPAIIMIQPPYTYSGFPMK